MSTHTTPTEELEIGEMRFLDNSTPKLAAGTYQIDINHDIKEPSHQIDAKYAYSQQFIVQAPRFSLPPNSVQGKFPTADTRTDFHASLPYIVLNEQHLPWSRKISSTVPAGSPWMVLMVFRAGEIVYTRPDDTDASPTLSTVRDVRTAVANYVSPDKKTIGPKIELDEIERTGNAMLRASTIDVLYTNFEKLAPRAAELPFLAHVRRTDNGGLVADDETRVRSYANLLANRLANPKNEDLYVAHLVSLEGWADYLPGSTPKPVVPGLTLRLVSLYSWKFRNRKDTVDFNGTINALDVDTLKLKFSPPAGWGNDETKYTPAQKDVKNKYKKGYVALNHDTRTGEKSFAWYRGPFTPVAPVKISNLVPKEEDGLLKTHITSADKAMIYDAETGIFNQSYAVAWELGRMLTLGNRPAAIAIWQWKKESMQKLQTLNRMITDQQKRRRQLYGAEENLTLGTLLEGLDWRQIRDDLMDDQAGKYIFMNYLGRGLGRHILGLDGSNGPVIASLDPTGLQQHLEALPGVLSTNEMISALENGIDPHVLLSDKLAALGRPGNQPNEQ
jgi:hypothetical protein